MTARRIRARRARMVATSLLAGSVALLGTAACGSGQIAQTATQVAAVPGTNVNIGPNGSIQLRNLQIQYADPQGYRAGENAPLVVRIFNSGEVAVSLVGVRADGAAESVVLTGGATPTASPSPSAEASPSAEVSPSTTASPSAEVSPSTTASPSAGASGSPTSQGPPIASAQPTATAQPDGGSPRFSVNVPPAAYALLVPGKGPYLQLVGLTSALIPGMSVSITFTFSGGTSVTVPVPLALPINSVPRQSVQPGEDNPGD